jgi:hypothetical protein
MKKNILALSALLLSSTVLAQWAWREGGSTIFSDQPPPPHITPSQILKKPASAAIGNDKVAPAKPNTEGRSKSLAEREAEFRERREKRTEQEKKVAEEAAKKQQLSQECERARTYLKALQDGIRVRSGPDLAVMGDEERQQEIQRVQKRVSSACQ